MSSDFNDSKLIHFHQFSNLRIRFWISERKDFIIGHLLKLPFLFKKVKKCLQVKKKCVPLQSQFEKVRIRPEMGQRIDSLAQ